MIHEHFPLPKGFKYQREVPSTLANNVYIFEESGTNKQYICKYFSKSKLGTQEQISKFIERLDNIKLIRSPQLVPYNKVIETEEGIYLLRKYIEMGPLTERIGALMHLDQFSLFDMWKGVFQVYIILHTHQIYPNFINPNNMFCLNDTTLVITDPVRPPLDVKLLTDCPNPFIIGFLSPEYFNQESIPDERSDYWALGVLLYFMIFKRMPWNNKNVFTISNQVTSGSYTIPDEEVIPEIKNALESLLRVKPEDRSIPSCVYETCSVPKKSQSSRLNFEEFKSSSNIPSGSLDFSFLCRMKTRRNTSSPYNVVTKEAIGKMVLNASRIKVRNTNDMRNVHRRATFNN